MTRPPVKPWTDEQRERVSEDAKQCWSAIVDAEEGVGYFTQDGPRSPVDRKAIAYGAGRFTGSWIIPMGAGRLRAALAELEREQLVTRTHVNRVRHWTVKRS